MRRTYYPQWRDENAFGRYPFTDSCDLTDVTGQLVLPNDWLVDAAIYSANCTPPVYISRLVTVENTLTVYLQDSLLQTIGTGRAARLSANPIAIFDAEGQPVATLVVGGSSNFAPFVLGDGDYSFVAESTEFVTSCVLQPGQSSMAGFSTGDRTLISSNLVLVGERGVRITVDDDFEVDANGQSTPIKLIRIHAIGDPQTLARNCEDTARIPTRFIRELVFQYGDETHICSPDQLGNIIITADSPGIADAVLRIHSLNNEIKFELMGRSI